MKPSFFILLCITIFFPRQISFGVADDAGKGSIEDVCSHTKDHDLCISILKFDPRSAGGKLKAYCVIVLEKALSKAENLKSKCPPEAYMALVEDIGDAIEKLKTKQPVAMVVNSIKNAVKDVGSCFDNGLSLINLLNMALAILKLIK